MQKVNALDLRQSLSKIIKKLQKTGEPILLEKGRKPAAVIISLEDFKQRFVEKEADSRRRALQQKILGLAKKGGDKKSAEQWVRSLRDESER